MGKDFLTVPELQDLCEKLNLSPEGLKRDLIGRVINFAPNSVGTVHQSTQTDEMLNTAPMKSATSYFNDRILKWIFGFGFTVAVGAMMLMMFFNGSDEIIEVTVQRPWFSWF